MVIAKFTIKAVLTNNAHDEPVISHEYNSQQSKSDADSACFCYCDAIYEVIDCVYYRD